MDVIRFYSVRFWRRSRSLIRYKIVSMRSRYHLVWRALTGKPMVIVRGSMIVDSADIHGGVWFDKGAHAEITNCYISNFPNNALEFKV